MKVLVTGSAGFIGAALSQALLARGDMVVWVDNHNDYYEVSLKEARLARFVDHPNYTHVRMDLADRDGIAALFAEHQFQRVVNLAAQAGVRYSLTNPLAYMDSNIVGFAHFLEGSLRSSSLVKAPACDGIDTGSWRKTLNLSHSKADCEGPGGRRLCLSYDRKRGLLIQS